MHYNHGLVVNSFFYYSLYMYLLNNCHSVNHLLSLLQENIFENYQAIVLRPEQFQRYLMSDEVGFVKCERIETPFNKSKGNLFVFQHSNKFINSGHKTPDSHASYL